MSKRRLDVDGNSSYQSSAISGSMVKRIKEELKMEVATKKIYKDMRKHGDSLAALSKAEQRIFQDLASNPATQSGALKDPAEKWFVTVDRLDELKQELVSKNQKTITDPMKKISRVYPSVNDAIKKREQSLLDYCKYQVKMDKQQEEKTPQNQAKVEEIKQNLAAAKADFERQNAVMLEDLPKLVDGRIDYFEPCFEALIRSEASCYKQAVQVFDELIKTLGCGEELLTYEDYHERLQQNLWTLERCRLLKTVSKT